MIDLADLYARIPRLAEADHRITSKPAEYNCVAWVTRDFAHWWAPGIHWPPPPFPQPRGPDDDLDCYIALFELWGYELCESEAYEQGWLKLAIYADGSAFHHVAKQLPSAAWSSKVGEAHDLRHVELEPLNQAAYWPGATASVYMRRPDDGTDPFTLEEGHLLLP
ncbi:MAG TPA: hypothetical protein VG652_04000 [Gaiellaceae bacterium]|nr:hypothetical protein [Gaiellaceae bacterium]